MPTYTTRNDLEKPGYADAADITVINGNMDIIDASLAKGKYNATAAPTVNDDDLDGYSVGSVWINTTGHTIYVCESASTGAAVWRQVYPGGVSPVSSASDPTVNDDSGDGYAVGQLWVNTTSKQTFLATDVTVGAAVWRKTLAADGTVPLTANWDVGTFEIRANTFQSDVATGTAPFTVASTTQVANLNAASAGNADTLDTYHAASFPLLVGRAGGQTLIGGTGASDGLILESTSHGTKGNTTITDGNLVVGTKATTATFGIAIHEGAAAAPNAIYFMDADGTTPIAGVFKSSADAICLASGDGTTADFYVNTSGNSIAVGSMTAAGVSSSAGMNSNRTLTDTGGSSGFAATARPTFTADQTNTQYNLYSACFPEVRTGKTNSGNVYSFYTETMRNHNGAATDDGGTLAGLYAQQAFFGHYNSHADEAPLTTYCAGIRVSPYYTTGTISNMYCIEVSSASTGGTVTNNWWLYNAHTGNSYNNGTYNRFQTTSGDRVIYVVQTSTTDPIADAWNTHSNEKYKNDLGPIDSDIDWSARYQARKAIADKTLHTWTRKTELDDRAHYEAMFPLEDDRPRGVPGEEIPAKPIEVREAEQDYAIYRHIEKCKTLKKFQKKNIGLFAEEAPEEIVSYSLDGQPEGIDLGAYIGWVHRAVDALHYDVDSVEVTVADMDYLLWEQDAINYGLTAANAELELRVKTLESKNDALLKKHEDYERRMALLEQRLAKLETP